MSPEKQMSASQPLVFLCGHCSYIKLPFFQTRKSALSELIRLFHKLICSLMSPEKQMSASQPLVFLCGSLYHKIAAEKSNIFFSNFQFDKIHIFSLFVAYVAIIIFQIVLILLH